MKKHGIENFTFEILIICFDNDVVKWEKEYIKKYNSQVPNGYNILSGGQIGDGNVGYRHSDEVKEIIKQKGREFRAKNPNYFETYREKHKKSMERVDTSSCVKNSDKFKNAMIRRKEEYGNGTKIMTDEFKKKISEGLKRYYENNSKNGVSDKHREIIRKAFSKPIIQYTKDGVLVREYPSIVEADHISGVKKIIYNMFSLEKLSSQEDSYGNIKRLQSQWNQRRRQIRVQNPRMTQFNHRRPNDMMQPRQARFPWLCFRTPRRYILMNDNRQVKRQQMVRSMQVIVFILHCQKETRHVRRGHQ